MNRIVQMLMAVVVAAGLTGMAAGQVDALSGEEVQDLIETLEVGEPVYCDNLTIVPIYTSHVKDRSHYATLDEALDKRWLEITEVDGGRVPQVRLRNRSDKYIFVMGGEILTGCRQDRIVGRDLLIRPHSKNVVVPVYCVEQGRWTYESDEFYSKKYLGTYDLRAEGQKGSGGAQGRIWGHIRSMCDRIGAPSVTDRFQEAYESAPARRKLSDLEGRMQRVPRLYPDVVGVVVAVGDEITSVDIFANPYVFKQLWPKMLKSSALAAISRDGRGMVTQTMAVRFLRHLHDKRYRQKPAIDLGLELSVVDDEVNANALVWQDAVIHLAAFPEGDFKWGSGGDEDSERRIRVMRRH